jgi:hypothetical protein
MPITVLGRTAVRWFACTAGKKCDKYIQFYTNVMRQADVEKIKSKCNVGRTVNIQRSFNDAGNGSSCLCKSGASIVVKECVLYDVPLGYVWFQLTHFLSFALPII